MVEPSGSSDTGRLSAVPSSSPAPSLGLHTAYATSIPQTTDRLGPSSHNSRSLNTFGMGSAAPPVSQARNASDFLSGSGFSASTEEILRRINSSSNAPMTLAPGTPGWEAAKQRVLQSMVTSQQFKPTGPTPTPEVTWVGRENDRDTSAHDVGSQRKIASWAPPQTVNGFANRGRTKGRASNVRKRGRGGKRGSKRKREIDDDETTEPTSSGTESSNFDANWTPGQTRSGRNINRPAQYAPTLPDGQSGNSNKRQRRSGDNTNGHSLDGMNVSASASQSRPSSPDTPAPTSSTTRLKLTLGPRVIANGNSTPPTRPANRNHEPISENSVCIRCQRGTSPEHNPIVYCDGCNIAYHKFCHQPVISAEVLAIAEADWFCADCQAGSSKRGKKGKGKIKLKITASQIAPPRLAEEKPPDVQNLIAGKTHEEKRQYFLSLPHATLVEYLLRLTSSELGKPDKTSPNGTAVMTNANHEPVRPVDQPEVLESVTDSAFPPPGHGIYHEVMPLETNDLDFLIDDNDEVFTHLVLNRVTGEYERATKPNTRRNGVL